MRRLLATTVLVTTLPGLAAAQDRPSLLDYFSLEVITQRMMQMGIMALRTQVDMKYSDISVDFYTGGITMTDVVAWPLPEWDTDGNCEVAIDRITLRAGALDEVDRLRSKMLVSGLSFPASCLPREPREALGMAGLSNVEIPRLTLDIDYGLPSSDATIRAYADITDVAIADLSAHFTYAWFDGRNDIEQPDPVMFLDHATLALENRGIWQALSGQLPPPFTGDGSGMFLVGMVGEGLKGENPGDADLSESQLAFTKSLGETWPAFVANPDTLVLETHIDGDSFLDFEAMGDDLRVVFDTLRPQLSLAPARVRDILPVSLLQASGSDISAEDRKKLGIALISGIGAPRNAAEGTRLLGGLAEAGDGEAAMAMAEAAEHKAPEEAYRWALLAGSADQKGATAMLDRLERKIAFARVLELQAEVSGGDKNSGAVLEKLSATRNEAAMRLSGRGQARSYEIAAMWAMIAAAAGDPEAADILEQLDERARLSGDAAQAAWATAEASASAKATEAWISQDLPARFGE